MTIKGKAYIAGAFEHPTRHAPDKTVAQLHAEVALGALADAGLTRADVDGYFCSGDAPGPGPASMAEYMNLKLRHAESTELGGASYMIDVSVGDNDGVHLERMFGEQGDDFIVMMVRRQLSNASDERLGIADGVGPVLWHLDLQGLGFAALPADVQSDEFRLWPFHDGHVAHEQT